MHRYFEGGAPLREGELKVIDAIVEDIRDDVPDDDLLMDCDRTAFLAAIVSQYVPDPPKPFSHGYHVLDTGRLSDLRRVKS